MLGRFGTNRAPAASSCSRNKIFLLMEELRRLKIQQKVKQEELTSAAGQPAALSSKDEDLTLVTDEQFKSALPFMPPISERTLNQYIAFFAFCTVGPTEVWSPRLGLPVEGPGRGTLGG